MADLPNKKYTCDVQKTYNESDDVNARDELSFVFHATFSPYYNTESNLKNSKEYMKRCLIDIESKKSKIEQLESNIKHLLKDVPPKYKYNVITSKLPIKTSADVTKYINSLDKLKIELVKKDGFTQKQVDFLFGGLDDIEYKYKIETSQSKEYTKYTSYRRSDLRDDLNDIIYHTNTLINPQNGEFKLDPQSLKKQLKDVLTKEFNIK